MMDSFLYLMVAALWFWNAIQNHRFDKLKERVHLLEHSDDGGKT